MCLVWNLNLGRASHLTSDLGKTNAFAMLMNVSVEDSSTFFAPRRVVKYQEKSNFHGDWKLLRLYHCLLKIKQKNDGAQHYKFGMSLTWSVR